MGKVQNPHWHLSAKCVGVTMRGKPCKKTITYFSNSKEARPKWWCAYHIRQAPPGGMDKFNAVQHRWLRWFTCRGINADGSRCTEEIEEDGRIFLWYCPKHEDQTA